MHEINSYLSSRPHAWHTHQHDIFAYNNFLNMLKRQLHVHHRPGRKKIQVLLQADFQTSEVKKGQICFWSLCLSSNRPQNKPEIASLFKNSPVTVMQVEVLLCILRYLNLSFLNKNLLIMRYFMLCSPKFVLSKRKTKYR